MADILDASGLTTSSFTEVRDALITEFKAIYGSDINVGQNSPDGQMINIFAQAGIDYRELATSIYNSFNPDNAIGIVLDERCAINNIQRQAGTFTEVTITIIVNKTVTLAGLDAEYNNINGTGYTIQDNSGTQFILIDTDTLTAGTYTLNFRAKNIGAVEVVANTLTVPLTIVNGVVSVNNPSAPIQIGENEETDPQFRLRRQRSVSINAQGYINSMQGRLLALTGVTQAKVFENYTNGVVNTMVPHSIWAIVQGGANSDIANVIYSTKSAGCNMNGSINIDITTPANQTFTALFDRPTSEDLYIRFDLKPLFVGIAFNQYDIKSYIVTNLIYTIGQSSYTTNITSIAQAGVDFFGGNGVVLNVEISLNGIAWYDFLDTTSLDNQFTVDATHITITEV